MCSLYVVAVSRESLGTLTFIMVAMIHPLISIPFAKFANCLYSLLIPCSLQICCKDASDHNGFVKFLHDYDNDDEACKANKISEELSERCRHIRKSENEAIQGFLLL